MTADFFLPTLSHLNERFLAPNIAHQEFRIYSIRYCMSTLYIMMIITIALVVLIAVFLSCGVKIIMISNPYMDRYIRLYALYMMFAPRLDRHRPN